MNLVYNKLRPVDLCTAEMVILKLTLHITAADKDTDDMYTPGGWYEGKG